MFNIIHLFLVILPSTITSFRVLMNSSITVPKPFTYF